MFFFVYRMKKKTFFPTNVVFYIYIYLDLVLFAHSRTLYSVASQSNTHTHSVSSVNTNRKTVIKLSIKRTSFIQLSLIYTVQIPWKLSLFHHQNRCDRHQQNETWTCPFWAVHIHHSFTWSNIYSIYPFFFGVCVLLKMPYKTLPSIHIYPHFHPHTSIYIPAIERFAKSKSC